MARSISKPSLIGLLLILLFALSLRLWRNDMFGIGHGYYSAAAVNMLQSPYHFFFTVADAGGVTVDKTPISLWIQSLSVALIGISGFALVLPSIFSNLVSICILYRLVSQDFGNIAGLIAAFVLATTPISIAVDHSNVADSILILALLITAWALLRAIRTQSLMRLLLTAITLGLAFNVKMLQAFIIAPAIYLSYFLGNKLGWWRKFQYLCFASLVLVLVSSAWLFVVEIIPKDQRPFIGSTRTNSSAELVFGYSALYRFLGSDQYYALFGEIPPIRSTNAVSVETGTPGPLRFFQKELGNELSWLLPYALWAMLMLFFGSRLRLPLNIEHQALFFWGTWLLAGMLVLSSLHVLHAFYLATLAPALAALIGIGTVKIWQQFQKNSPVGLFNAYASLLLTLAFQFILASYYPIDIWHFFVLMASSFIIFTLAGIFQWKNVSLFSYLVTLLLIPTLWGLATAAERFDITVPVAYEARTSQIVRADLIINLVEGEYSITNTVVRDESRRYDLVVSNQGFGASITMHTNLRVLYLGGFSGNDPIYTVESFARLLDAGEIGFVLDTSHHPEIMSYVAYRCRAVRDVIEPHINRETGMPSGGIRLYQC